jgi:hypothetical protein
MTEKGIISGLLFDYGWIIMEYGNGQKRGSCADIYAESMDGTFHMIIDDGNVSPFDTIYHIYCGSLDGKIFEGRPMDISDFETMMRLLGFEKI